MVDLSGERLSDERLAEIAGGVWHRMPGTIEVAEMVAELRRHRAAQRADAERVRSVVRDAVYAEMRHHDNESIQSADWVEMRNAIANRVAAELATAAPASAPVLSTEEHAAAERFVAWAVDDIDASADPSWAEHKAGADIVRRLLRGGGS